MINNRTSHRKITTYRLSPEMNTWTPAATVNNLPLQGHCRSFVRSFCFCLMSSDAKSILGTIYKVSLFWIYHSNTGFNTLDNWGHKTPTQSKRKRTGKKRLKGHGPEHLYNTLGNKKKKIAPLCVMMMMNWCLMSSDVMRHIRDKLWPMPKHGAINLYVHGNQKAR